MRSTFEKAISICGLDMYDGGTIWSRYKDFEIEELEDCIDLEAPTEVIQEAKKRLVNIFRRQLAQPLSENDTVLQNLDDCLSQMFVESDVDIINPSSISSAYQTGLDLRTVRQPFEDNILSDQFQVLSEDERASRWVNYIDFEIKDNQIFRAQRLYERAVLNCTQSCLLWQNYIYFALNRVKNWVLLESVLSRALKIEGCKQNIECWKVKYLTVELINLKSETTLGQVSLLTPDSENFITCSGQIYNVFQLSTQVKFVNRTYYWMTMKMYCDFFKRYLVQLVTQGSREADLFLALNNLWNALDYVEYYLVNYFGDWEEGWLLYSHYRMNCEDNLIENICESVDGQLENQSIESKSEIVWDRIIQKFPKSYPIWKSYIQWAHNRNKEITFCRKLYKKALVHLDDTLVPCCALNPFSQISILITDELHLINPQEELLAQWIGYEEEYGSVNDVISALAKWNKNSFDFSRLSRSGKGVAKSKKRAATEQPNTSVISKKKKSDSKDKSVLAGTTESEDGPPPSVGTYAVFLKNIPFTTTEEQLFQLFQHCGKILKVDLLKSLGGKSRGMAQIDFYSEPAVNEALRLNNTLIDDRPMTVQRYYPDSLDSSFHPSTLFISKIPRDASDEELRGCFSKLENVEIVACRIVVDKKTGLSKVTNRIVPLIFYRVMDSFSSLIP